MLVSCHTSCAHGLDTSQDVVHIGQDDELADSSTRIQQRATDLTALAHNQTRDTLLDLEF
jgi:hypothetical protein